jgi:flavin-binding protein dodecin
MIETKEEPKMSSVARVTEMIALSKKSFNDALESGVKRATKTLKNVTGAWVASQDVVIAKGRITEYRVRLKVTFVLAE